MIPEIKIRALQQLQHYLFNFMNGIPDSVVNYHTFSMDHNLSYMEGSDKIGPCVFMGTIDWFKERGFKTVTQSVNVDGNLNILDRDYHISYRGLYSDKAVKAFFGLTDSEYEQLFCSNKYDKVEGRKHLVPRQPDVFEFSKNLNEFIERVKWYNDR